MLPITSIRYLDAAGAMSLPGLGSVRVECLGTVPLGTAPSTASLVATADSMLQVSETSESNNTDTHAMRVLINAVDLEAQALYCWGVA